MENKNADQPIISFFHNENGDVTLTHYGEPIAICENEDSAIKLQNSFNALLLRIDVLSKMELSNFKPER